MFRYRNSEHASPKSGVRGEIGLIFLFDYAILFLFTQCYICPSTKYIIQLSSGQKMGTNTWKNVISVSQHILSRMDAHLNMHYFYAVH
jgi:hypothetical protein